VTFELGTNDLCDDPKTDPVDFEVQARTAVQVLGAGLPPGSRMLMLAVPDFAHLHDITQADPTSRAAFQLYANSRRCAPFLGTNTPTSMADAKAILAAYDEALARVCDELNAGPNAGRLHCTYDEADLSLRDFTVADLSTVDYFHPSISGQARIAQAAWQAGAWAGESLPSGYARSPGDIRPGSGAGGSAPAAALLVPVAPLPLRRRVTLLRVSARSPR
jgi:lysophospholipase L1-like esterase